MSFRAAALLLFAAFAAFPQSWDSLRQLQTGQHVVVLDTEGRDHKGEFRAYTADTIRIAKGRNDDAIPRAKVRRVQVPSGSHRLRNSLIGAGIGLAVGLTIDYTLGDYFRNETGQSEGMRAITYIAPIGILGGIGAALPSYRTIYRAP